MKRPPVYLQSGESCLSTIVLTISLTKSSNWTAVIGHPRDHPTITYTENQSQSSILLYTIIIKITISDRRETYFLARPHDLRADLDFYVILQR